MKIKREPFAVLHTDPSPIKDVYGGDVGMVFVECMRIRPVDVESKTVIVFSHPIGGGSFLPLVNRLAQSGTHVVYCNPRYRGNDTALIMEKCVLDLGACIKDLRERFGHLCHGVVSCRQHVGPPARLAFDREQVGRGKAAANDAFAEAWWIGRPAAWRND